MSPELLPYELVQASRAVDVWAIGVLLFAFVTGQSLIPVDKNDDITEGQYMRYIAEWTEADCTAKLASGEDHALHPAAGKRSSALGEV